MGITFDKMVEILELCQIKAGRRLLDIGCSNIYTLTADDLAAFVRRHNDIYEEASLRAWAEHVAAGGVMDPEVGGANGAWLGDVLTRAGFHYQAFDIFPGYKTQYFDLNRDALSPEHRGAYDLVLNFGTTEHLIGQYNAFGVIHEAAAKGAYIVHDLPMTGYLDHGYFGYNPMFFHHLADANGYEVVTMRFSGSVGDESVGRLLVERYLRYAFMHTRADEAPWLDMKVPTSSVFVIFRKVKDAPFRTGLEISTTAGAVPREISEHYGASSNISTLQSTLLNGDWRAALHALRRQGRVAKAQARSARDHLRLVLAHHLRRSDPETRLDRLANVYHAHLIADAGKPFLHAGLLRSARDQCAVSRATPQRTPAVAQSLHRTYPLAAYLSLAAATPPPLLRFDGAETGLDPYALSLETLLAAYAAYFRFASLTEFPRTWEAAALLLASRRFPSDKVVHARMGKVLATLTPEMEVRRAS